MRKIFAVGVVLFAASVYAAAGDYSEEVLVLNSAAVELPVRHPTRKGALIQNGGTTSIFCAVGRQTDGGVGSVFNRGVAVVSNGSMYVAGGASMFCQAQTSDQALDAGTRVMEIP